VKKKDPGRSSVARPLIRKLRKPLAPPTRVADEERKYKRAQEHERLRREGDPETDENLK
jgi:hypothetical protein